MLRHREVGSALFGTVVLAIALVAWAGSTANLVRIPVVFSPSLGLVVSIAGAVLFALGLARRLRFFPHPVYTGFCIACAGVSIAVGSASGLWLVSPIVALGCAALVTRQRQPFSPAQILPEAGTSPPTAEDRLRFYLFVLLPWLVLYELILAIGIPPDAISGMSSFEQRLPVFEWTQIIYASTYFLTLLAPVFARTRNDLRNYSVRALWTMLLAYPAFLLIPLIAPKRPFTPHTLPGHLLIWERSLDSPVAAFPSFHVIWAMLAAEVFARRWPKLKSLFYGWAILVAASCVTTSQHSILDVLGGAATVALVVRGPRPWTILRFAKRSMSRAVYTGLAAFFALLLAETMAGIGAQNLEFTPLLIVAALIVGASLAYATPWSFAIAAILTRLWFLGAPLHLIVGLSLILAALGSFAAETQFYESLIPISRRHRALITIALAGILLTAFGQSAPAPKPHFTWLALLPATVLGLAAALLRGLDFQAQNRPIPVLQSTAKR